MALLHRDLSHPRDSRISKCSSGGASKEKHIRLIVGSFGQIFEAHSQVALGGRVYIQKACQRCPDIKPQILGFKKYLRGGGGHILVAILGLQRRAR